VNDEDMNEPDYIPGVDDGEWGEAEEEGWTLRNCKVDNDK
jgi:hypothetical protein